ncbi:MAG: flavin reductase family protein [Ruminococcaceae bacterium]|nr:flavin reductase family protein [Oscillospiraceae bacterium]
MRKNFNDKRRGPILYPQPVFIIAAYNDDGTPNAMNVAWGGISDSDELSFCVAEDHKTTRNILSRKAFTVSMADVAHVVECDYLGLVSGNDVPDKMIRAGFHCIKSEFIDAPIIQELPMAIECTLVSYDEESCRLVGKIVNVSADECVLKEDGRIDPSKLRPITYDSMNQAYLVIGEKVGNAFRDGVKLK